MDSDSRRQRKTHTGNKSICKHGLRKIQDKGIMGMATPKLSQLYILRSECATLIRSNPVTFGQECVRLVNIVFHSSQIFPSMVGTVGGVTEHLHEALRKKHPHQHFHVVVGENDRYSFAIDDAVKYAEIEQENYRVMIFSMKPASNVEVNTSSANNHMKLCWKSVILK